MREDKEQIEEKKPLNKKLVMTFAIVVLAAFFIVELYLMMNYSKGYFVLGFIGLLMLCLVYFIVDLNFKIQNETAANYEKEYENIFKSEKVSYIMMKQSFLEMAEILEDIKKNCDFPVDELINAQKAVAKVTIQRSKENAIAIMNCNDQLIDRMVTFEERLKEISQVMENRENDSSAKLAEDVVEKQQEIISYVEKLEGALKEQINRLEDSIDSKIKSIDIKVPVNPVIAEEPVVMEEKPVAIEESGVIEEEPTVVEEPVVMEEESIAIEEPVAEEEPVVEEAPAFDPNHIMTPEEIAALVSGAGATAEEPAAEEEPVAVEEPVVEEEPVFDPNHIMTPEEIAALVSGAGDTAEEPVAEEEPVVEEEPAFDSNHIMTPEEIAALVGGMGSTEEEPVVEEAPPMPDLTDPNHVMTPEEIAALLANM